MDQLDSMEDIVLLSNPTVFLMFFFPFYGSVGVVLKTFYFYPMPEHFSVGVRHTTREKIEHWLVNAEVFAIFVQVHAGASVIGDTPFSSLH